MKLNNKDTDLDSMITTFNTAVTETASEILGKHRQKKNPLVTITTFNTAVTETASKILSKHRQKEKQTSGSLQKFSVCVTEGEN